VAIHATSDADQFRLKVKTLTIEVAAAGNAPAAVNNLVVTPTPNKVEATIVFEAPSVTIDGNEMTENLTNIDVLRDGVVIESVADVAPGSERTIVDNEEKGLTIGTHKYQVIPYNASGIGAKSDIIEVMVVTAVDVPYTFDFSQAGCLDLMQVIDNMPTARPGSGAPLTTPTATTAPRCPPTTTSSRYPSTWWLARSMPSA